MAATKRTRVGVATGDNDWWIDALLYPVRDPSLPHSLRVALESGMVPDEYRQEAIELIGSYPYPRKPKTALPARSLHNDTSWDNVLRALEEDR